LGSSQEKAAFKILMKLTAGVNFINILRMLFCRYPFAKKLRSQNVTRENLRKALLCKKMWCKMLMKLTTGVNFINIL